MGCLSSKPVVPVPETIPMRSVTRTEPVPTPHQTVPEPHPAQVSRAPSQGRGRRGSTSTASTRSAKDLHDSTRHRTASAPQRVPSMPSQPENSRSAMYQTVAVPSMGIRTGTRSGPRFSTSAHTKTATRALISTMHQVLSNHTKFRILVVGKKGSGKSSLINAVFKVDTSAATGNINQGIYRDDNRYLISHEYSAFGPGEGENLRAIQDFISNRTDPARLPTERLHAIWICVTASDAMSGSIGEGVEEILNMRRVPTVVAFTKFDQTVALEGETLAKAHTRFEESCRSLFGKEPRNVPAEMVSVRPQFDELVENLVVTTDEFIRGSRTPSGLSGRSSAQGAKPRIAAASLVWSAALRVNQDIFIKASIEVGRSRYWRGLWSSIDFANQPLKECVNVIHTDIVEIWNLSDRNRCLSSNDVKAKMSHIVRDLAGSVRSVSPSPDFAEWVYDVYRGSQENVQCVMGYIVDLTAILDGVFRIASDSVSEEAIQMAMKKHANSDSSDSIHRDIRSFVTEMFPSRFEPSKKDVLLEKIDDLIGQYCVSSRAS